ncbi:MAG: U32 family peptidase [Tissierellia bacterium]|nr:U32 family peptidase [Tissierellia bacterium]
MSRVELLAPAGDLDKLKTAIDYGADAVFMAGQEFGLRTASKNFSNEEIKEAVKYVHDRNKKIYITMNIIAHEIDFEKLDDYIIFLSEVGVDGVIVADPGIFMRIREKAPNLEQHISTQASITNAETVNFWYKLGARRVVLARELSIDEIKSIRANIPEDMELEVFVHGAMCISYSGRCLLSNYFTHRDANHGDCAQSCRWKYRLVEETRPGEYYPIEENERGTFIFNSKDLCLIEYIDQLIEAGISSLKIEGRVKTQFYVATVVRAYRLAVDAYYDGQYDDQLKAYLMEEIKKASYRDFTTGFLFGRPDDKGQNYDSSAYIRSYDFLATVLEYDGDKNEVLVEQRNKFVVGDEIEVFGPYKEVHKTKIEYIKDQDGKLLEMANQAKQIVSINMPVEVLKGDMLRRKVDEDK